MIFVNYRFQTTNNIKPRWQIVKPTTGNRSRMIERGIPTIPIVIDMGGGVGTMVIDRGGVQLIIYSILA